MFAVPSCVKSMAGTVAMSCGAGQGGGQGLAVPVGDRTCVEAGAIDLDCAIRRTIRKLAGINVHKAQGRRRYRSGGDGEVDGLRGAAAGRRVHDRDGVGSGGIEVCCGECEVEVGRVDEASLTRTAVQLQYGGGHETGAHDSDRRWEGLVDGGRCEADDDCCRIRNRDAITVR
jgi:hypothetical protein